MNSKNSDVRAGFELIPIYTECMRSTDRLSMFHLILLSVFFYYIPYIKKDSPVINKVV